MKERGSFVDFPGLKLCLGAFAILLSYTAVFGHVNHCNTIGCRFLFSVEPTTDSIPCAFLSDDSIAKFVRLDHSDNEYDYYYLKLSMFPIESERSIFYEEARGIECYITDKRDFLNDSALFSTRKQDRDQFLLKLTDLYENAKNGKQSLSNSEKSQNEESPGFYRPVEPGGNGHDSPMDVSLVCDGAQVACSNNVYSYPAGTTGQAPPAVNNYPNYGCLGSEPCPAWFFMQVGVAGDIIIFISQSGNHDVDFICWGPFSSLTDGCATGLTGTCHPVPLCCNNTQPSCANFYPRGNIVDCSYSPNSTETCHILNAQVGDMYILLITNYSQQPGTITFSQTGGSGVTNCNIVVHCSMIAITTNTSSCSGTTNTYSVSGNIEFSNPPATGTLTITDITAIPQVSQTLYPPFVSPLAYNLSNIPCDGAVHTLSATFSDSLACTMTKQYTAPPENCPQAQISGGGEICSDGSTTTNITINFTGTGPFDFTYAINGVPQTPVTGYNGPFPYVFGTNIPGTYTLVSLSNVACPGTGIVSGSAIVIAEPLPVPSIAGNSTVCSASAGNVYTTESGMSNYLWTVSLGGTITAGGGLNDDTITVTWNTPGIQTITVNYTNGQGCHAASPTINNVNVNPLPLITNAGSITVCSGTTINIIPVANIPGTTFSWIASGSSSYVSGFSSGSGNSINDQLVNTGFNVETVTYLVTSQVNNCTSDPVNFVVAVEPVTDAYFNPASQILCSGHTSNIQILSHVSGSTFTWTSSGSSANVSGFSAGGGNVIQQTLINSGYSIETVTYEVTPVINGCTGTPNNVIVTVDPMPVVLLTSCWDPKTTTTAKPFKLKGGIPLGGTYSGAGINSGIFTPTLVETGTHTIHYSYTNNFGCIGIASQTITVIFISPPGFTCGNTLTDIRDNKTYPTIQIGTQCWMAANLDYGILIPGSLTQRDNCIPEKYCYNDLNANCGLQTYYQWDELIQYDETISNQGFCPPGWHIPTETEWNTLFDVFISNGFAGNPLKTTGYSGFNALLSGTRHLDKTWDFLGFATFFWSSTLHGTDKAWAHGMNSPDPSVSVYSAYKSNAFSVRCLKD